LQHPHISFPRQQHICIPLPMYLHTIAITTFDIGLWECGQKPLKTFLQHANSIKLLFFRIEKSINRLFKSKIRIVHRHYRIDIRIIEILQIKFDNLVDQIMSWLNTTQKIFPHPHILAPISHRTLKFFSPTLMLPQYILFFQPLQHPLSHSYFQIFIFSPRQVNSLCTVTHHQLQRITQHPYLPHQWMCKTILHHICLKQRQ